MRKRRNVGKEGKAGEDGRGRGAQSGWRKWLKMGEKEVQD